MARRARMLALLQLSMLVFLLVAELTDTAPVSDGSSANITGNGGNSIFSEENGDVSHTSAPSETLKSEDHATTIQGGNSVSEEEVNVQENSLATKASSEESAEENADKDEDFKSTKSTEMAVATEESEEVSEENTDEHKNSLSIKNEEASNAVSDANVDTQDSLGSRSGEVDKKTEGSDVTLKENVGKLEDYASTETEEDKSASQATDAVSGESMEKQDSMVTKTEENTSDTETKENVDNVDGSVIDTSGEDLHTPEHTDKLEAKAIDDSATKEQIETAVAGDESNEGSDEFVGTSNDKIVENGAVEPISPDKGSEESREDEAAEESALKEDISEEEVVSGENKEREDKHGTVLKSSSEETSVAENETEDIKVNGNESSAHHESYVTNSPFAQLRVPSSDSHHIDGPHNDKDAAGHESENPSIEETAENESGSPDELIENDSVDSEVINSDNKTAALGKAMEMTGAEENVHNKDEGDKTKGLQDTKQDLETPVAVNKLENTEGKDSVEHQDTGNGEEKVENTLDKEPETIHEPESKETVPDEEENDKANLLGKEDRHPKGLFEHKNEDEVLDVAEENLNILHGTESPSEEEGSGAAANMMVFASHGDDGHKNTSETINQEKHEAGSTVRKDNSLVSSKEEETAEEAGHPVGVFEASGSGHEEEEPEHVAKQENNGTDNAEEGSGSHALHEHEDDIIPEEHTTESNIFSSVPHVPIVDDNEHSAEYYSESPGPESEMSSEMPISGDADNQDENSGHHLKEENLAENKTNAQVMSVNPDPVPDGSNDNYMGFDGSGDDDTTTTPVPVLDGVSDEVLANIMKDIIDDNMEVSSKEMVNSSVIGEVSPAYQEKPMEKVISPRLESAPHTPTTEPPCMEDADNEDCLLQSNKPHEDAGITNILEDDDEVPPEPTKADVHSQSTSNDNFEIVIISTTPAVKVSSEEESSQRSIAVNLNEPHLHFSEEVSSTTVAAEMQEITEPVEDHDAVDNETVISDGAPDTIVEHTLGDTGVKEMSGKLKVANVNELGVSGQENSEDLAESEALDSSTASGSYVVLGCIMAVVVVLLAYAAIKSRRERATNTNSKKQNEIAGDDDDGTELKDMKKALLPPETPHDDCNGDIEANRKPLIDKEEDEEKEPIIKQNGTLELSEPPRDVESQVDSSPAQNQLKTAPTPTANKPQQRNGLSEVVVEKPAISNGKTESLITHPVSAKVRVIENEDSIAKTPVIINRGSNSPSH